VDASESAVATTRFY